MFRRSLHLAAYLAAALAVLALIPSAAGAVTELSGQTPSGAYYKIVAPDAWTPADGLVIWNHGFSLSPIGPVEDLGPLAELQLSEGYAVAASSYSLPGWAVFQTVADNRGMLDVFEDALGVPDFILVYGASLGGLVTAQSIEVGDLGNVIGAMPICGALAGSRLWDGAVDLRLIYDAVCGDVPGAAIPGGANGLPFPPDPTFNLGAAIAACTGLGLPSPSDEQTARLAQILDVTGLPVNFLGTDMGFATFGLADLVYDPRKLAGGAAFDNQHVDYGDAAINATIERVTANQSVRRRFFDNYTPSGKVGDVKIVSLHTDKDGLVLVENEREYAEIVPPQNLSVGIVVEDTPSHCGFTDAEVVAAWESLRGWLGGQPQPTPASLQQTCEGLVAGGLADGPCRIDPELAVSEIDELGGRVRPRESCTASDVALCLNDGRFRVEITFRDFEGQDGVGHTTAFQTDDTGSFWFFDSANVEMVVKALDGRQDNGNFWIFYGSLTNVAFEMTVTDTVTGLVKTYDNSLGTFASNGDIDAF